MNVRPWSYLVFSTCVAAIGCGDSGDGAGGSTSTTTSTTSATSTSTGGDTTACQRACEMNNAAGYTLLSQIVVESCACVMKTPPPPCQMACMTETACTDGMVNMGTPTVGGACETCIMNEGAKGAGSQCSVLAAVSMECSNDAACKALVMCEQGCFAGG